MRLSVSAAASPYFDFEPSSRTLVASIENRSTLPAPMYKRAARGTELRVQLAGVAFGASDAGLGLRDLLRRGFDCALRLQVLLVEHIGAVVVGLDLRLDALRLRGQRTEIARWGRARGRHPREGRAGGQGHRQDERETPPPYWRGAASGAVAPPQHGGRW